MIENIKKLYEKIPANERIAFSALVAEDFNIQPTTVYNHWFGKFWIPVSKQARVLELLENKVSV